ncbi:MAG TPA: SpoIIE family protein phosphatase [Polyangiaceae bacterium]|nr:SpoIIE family protein phosphatase [Polyangiaceae bacterium]
MSPASDRNPTLLPGVIACTLRGRRASDAIEIVTERDGAVGLVMLDVRAAREQEALRARLASSALVSLAEREPMHVLANSLRSIVCQAVAASVGVVALRVHPMHGRVELLNAGMPPVACALPDGRLLQMPALSQDIGPRSQRAHPYELIPLAPGSVWFVASDGATSGSLDETNPLWGALGLPSSALELASESHEGLQRRLREQLGELPLPEDASLVVVPTALPRRTESGIRES